jgi:hypothetical protein
MESDAIRDEMFFLSTRNVSIIRRLFVENDEVLKNKRLFEVRFRANIGKGGYVAHVNFIVCRVIIYFFN